MNFCFQTIEDKGILISSLAYRVYIRWWDRFQQSIAIPKKCDLFPPEPVLTPLPGPSNSVPPPALPPNIYAWYLQVTIDNPGISHDEAVKLSYLLNSYGITLQIKCLPEPTRPTSPQFHFLPEPTPMASEEIHEMTTRMTETPQFSQSPWSTKDLQCNLCGNIGHTALVCTEFKVPEFHQGPCCLCCGQFGHTAFCCLTIDRSPSPMQSPSRVAESQQSSSKTIFLDSAHSPWSTVYPSVVVGPSTVVPTTVVPIESTSAGPKGTTTGFPKVEPIL